MTSLQPQSVLVQPNQFLLRGYDIEISYETTSFVGTPRLSFIRQEQILNFSGKEIQSENTQLGQIVTVQLSDNQKAASTIETLSLLIPVVSLLSTTKTAPIQTMAIFSQRSSQMKIAGQSQIYTTVDLSGTANQCKVYLYAQCLN
jgi:hypothetical protein